MITEQYIASLRQTMTAMNPAKLVESERLIDELRVTVASMSPEEAADAAHALAECRDLTQAASHLLRQVLSAAGLPPDGYASYANSPQAGQTVNIRG